MYIIEAVILIFSLFSFQQYTPSYGYNLTQQAQGQTATQLGQPSFSQPSLFLPTGPPLGAAAPQNDLYGSSSQVPTYRSQYGQSQQNTIMVSSSTSSLMSATIKPPSAPSQFSTYLSLFILSNSF